ncbi:MAG: amidophosphoribosyltransferase [Methanomassiliicoccales archaeon]
MDDKPKHACGVVAMAMESDVNIVLKKALRVIQHRGQESTGIAVYDGNIKYVRGMGLAHEVFCGPEFYDLKGNMGIAHVRYSTSGDSSMENCQPIVVSTAVGELSLAHNGDIVNADDLRRELQDKGWAFLTNTDSEIIVRILADEVSETKDMFKAIRNTIRMLVGAYSLTIMIGNRVFGVRDPMGFHPLMLGRMTGGYGIASEDPVFEVLGGNCIRDVEPGEIVEITPEGYTSSRIPRPPERAACMFEYVYFARPDSTIDGLEVFQARKNVGRVLARDKPADADVVIAVPDSGRGHAMGFSEGSGIQYDEGLMKNRYVERTFIMPEQAAREEGVSLKLNPIKSTVKDRKVVLVDDSIVRGTTLRRIVQMVRRAGAKEVHVRIGCPPIVAPCYYGIDMKTRDQFVASDRSVEEIAKELTADSLGYNTPEALVEALGISRNNLCMACLTGEYPTRVPGERKRFQKKLDLHFSQ